jgi:Rod binding domain-containing protein
MEMKLESLPALQIPKDPERAKLMEKAKELEAAFLSEMLSYSGLGESSESFGGGIGEDQFASFLRNEQARLMVEKGGIGLAQTMFESLVRAQEGKNDR